MGRRPLYTFSGAPRLTARRPQFPRFSRCFDPWRSSHGIAGRKLSLDRVRRIGGECLDFCELFPSLQTYFQTYVLYFFNNILLTGLVFGGITLTLGGGCGRQRRRAWRPTMGTGGRTGCWAGRDGADCGQGVGWWGFRGGTVRRRPRWASSTRGRRLTVAWVPARPVRHCDHLRSGPFGVSAVAVERQLRCRTFN
jgi:hypothetical protein